jgi:CubicO group peptidase (beta-lactamase class C family)
MKVPLILFLLVCLLAPLHARAADKPALLPKAVVDRHVQSIIEGDYAPGLVVGIIDSTGSHVYGYGTLRKGADQTPDGNSIFEIGSVTKLFTATVYAQMLADNELPMNEPADAILTKVKVPSDGLNKILLIHLACHSASLPLNPSNLTSRQPDNPYFGYTQRQFADFLSKCVLARPPGRRFAYSNVGYALLAQALCEKEAKTYQQLITDRICTPLGMTHTTVSIPPSSDAHLSHAYTVDGDEVAYWDCPPFEGSFGLKSTANDLLAFCSAHLGLTQVPFTDALKSMQSRQIDIDTQNDMGIGWQIGRRIDAVWQEGQTGGEHAFLACLPKRKAAVVILANSAFPYISTLGVNLTRALAGDNVGVIDLRIARAVPPATLDQYVGEYAVNASQALTVTREADSLYIRANNQPRLRLYADSPQTFFGKSVQCLVEFVAGESGKIDHLVFHQRGHDIPAKKVK